MTIIATAYCGGLLASKAALRGVVVAITIGIRDTFSVIVAIGVVAAITSKVGRKILVFYAGLLVKVLRWGGWVVHFAQVVEHIGGAL